MVMKRLLAAILPFLCLAALPVRADSGFGRPAFQEQASSVKPAAAAMAEPGCVSMNGERNMKVYDFTVETDSGSMQSLAAYRGKVLLVVNTASKCGFTPQFGELQELYLKYRDRGLEILGFPCNQFAGQEPGTSEEAKTFCSLNYGVTFPMFAKIDVRGETAHPLFKYLSEAKGFGGFDESHPLAKVLREALEKNFPEYLKGNGIKWNFTKFLVDRQGNVVARFEPTSSPAAIASDIEKFLEQP
jgi:glutathione peroxidase